MAPGEAAKPDTHMWEAHYYTGDKVWVGQSRGSTREGTVVRYLGRGSYSVSIAERGVRSVDEGLLSLRQEEEGAGGLALEGVMAETSRRAAASEKRSLIGQRRIRWYNPKLETFEWKEAPKSDEEALSLLDGSPYVPTCTQTYWEWRGLGSSIAVALIRAGEAAKEEGEEARP
jgi:hypothetical protein